MPQPWGRGAPTVQCTHPPACSPAHTASCSMVGERVLCATMLLLYIPLCAAPPSPNPPVNILLDTGPQRRSMFIQTQTTPNPASLMFLPGQSIMGAEGGTKHFGSAREGMASPLAKRLFMVRRCCRQGGDVGCSTALHVHVSAVHTFLIVHGCMYMCVHNMLIRSVLRACCTQIDGVSGVFFGTDFVTVTKRDDYSWAVLKPDIFAAIMDHFAGGMCHLRGEGGAESCVYRVMQNHCACCCKASPTTRTTYQFTLTTLAHKTNNQSRSTPSPPQPTPIPSHPR